MTIILIIMWVITRMPGNPITGRGRPLNEIVLQYCNTSITNSIRCDNSNNRNEGKERPCERKAKDESLNA
jgi:hypothetical protein